MTNESVGADLATALRDTVRLERAVADAQAAAVRRHHRLGQPVVVWRDGRVVELPPPDAAAGATAAER